MSLSSFLVDKGFNWFRDYIEYNSEQVEQLKNIIGITEINVMEIGFNSGHFAELSLQHNNNLNLTSFDAGVHDYVKYSKQYIDLTYPNRHTLIIGGCGITIPDYIQNNPNNPTVKFDVIFINNVYEYDIITTYINNCFYLSHKDTVIILNNAIPINNLKNYQSCWAVGPTKVWDDYSRYLPLENVETDGARTIVILSKNKIVNSISYNYGDGKGMSYGKYNPKMFEIPS